jgi:hypothetical protein
MFSFIIAHVNPCLAAKAIKERRNALGVARARTLSDRAQARTRHRRVAHAKKYQ